MIFALFPIKEPKDTLGPPEATTLLSKSNKDENVVTLDDVSSINRCSLIVILSPIKLWLPARTLKTPNVSEEAK